MHKDNILDEVFKFRVGEEVASVNSPQNKMIITERILSETQKETVILYQLNNDIMYIKENDLIKYVNKPTIIEVFKSKEDAKV